jgi:hypothetical protein
MDAILGALPAQMVSVIPHDIMAALESPRWFPQTLADEFMPSLRLSFIIGAVLSGIAAVLSAMRGEKYVHEIHGKGIEAKAMVPAERK